MKTCLVTGGAGFIGSHLSERLLEMGSRVVVVDNLVTGSEENIKHLIEREDFVFIEADVTKLSTYKNDLKGKYDYIFHLASPASPNKDSELSYLSHPIETMLVNSLGTYRLLKLAKKCGSKFLFASTSEVYGDPEKHPQKESYWGNVNPNGIRSCYDESKRYGEAMTMVYRREFNVNARIVRIFNTYGPKMDPNDGRVVVNFVLQGLKDEDLTVYGDGEQTRSFCYVADMVEGIIKVGMEKEARGEVFNLGNQDEYTINQLVDTVVKQLNIEKKTTNLPLPEDDPTRRRPDISKAKEVLGWEPEVPLEEGLKKTIEYFKDKA